MSHDMDMVRVVTTRRSPISGAEVRAFLPYAMRSTRLARNTLGAMTATHRARLWEAILRQPGAHILHDPIEDDAPTLALIHEAREMAKAQILARIGGRLGLGSCHEIWEATSQLLQTKHGIAWFSPAAMNPFVDFD
jgi:hypothetical protein